MQYDHGIDYTIINALNDKEIVHKYALYVGKKTERKKKEELHFEGILKAVGGSYRTITHRILSLHLEWLEKQKIIERDKVIKVGHPRFYRLNKNIKWALKLELPVRVRSERREFLLPSKKHDNMKNKKVYLLLMSLVAIGFSVPEPVNDPRKVEKGDFLDNEGKSSRMSPRLPGMSTSNFFHEYRDSSNGWRFRDVKFQNALEVEWYFKKLMEYDPPIIRPINEIEWIKKDRLQRHLPWPIEEHKEMQYGITDKLLYEWMSYCVGLLGWTEMLMKYIWKYKRKPTSDEGEWYSFIHGKACQRTFFLKINKTRSRLKKIIGTAAKQMDKAYAEAYAAYKTAVETGKRSLEYESACEIMDYISGYRTIDRIKSSSYYWHRKLSSEEYKDIHENYGIITNTFLEVAYPDFMEDISSV